MSYTGEDGEDVPFRLMDQVRPHWRELAIALKFPQHEIAIMEHKDNSVYYLLTEWLRGANQEKDPRPVTWETLITALRAANIQEEAKFLEKHLDNSAHVAEQSQQGELIVGFCKALYVLSPQASVVPLIAHVSACNCHQSRFTACSVLKSVIKHAIDTYNEPWIKR